MKTNLYSSFLFVILFASPLIAQKKTTVNAMNSEISDNLDLRAVASLFGEARNLEDFERKLNDPEIQISNLDLNNDNRVDYLRVIESVEGFTHLIVLQSVLGSNTFQDVATIEVERNGYNDVNIQVVGDAYMYGPNYIYEPVYAYSPPMYASFWNTQYHPYCSSSYWNSYPAYYYGWNPYPVFRYQNNIVGYIDYNNYYNYVNYRRSERAVALYHNNRAKYCERRYPSSSFAHRNASVRNKYELDQTHDPLSSSAQNQVAVSPRNFELTSRPRPIATRNFENAVRENTNPVRNYNVSLTKQNTLAHVIRESQDYSANSGNFTQRNPPLDSSLSKDPNVSKSEDNRGNQTRITQQNPSMSPSFASETTAMRPQRHEDFGALSNLPKDNYNVTEHTPNMQQTTGRR